jgi:hypothetical protein
MKAPHISFLAFSLALALLFGCTQVSVPQACSGVPQEKLESCIYVNAVLEQNSYTCYSITPGSNRVKCLKDASDSAMKKRLDGMSPLERENALSPKAAVPVEIPDVPPAQPPVIVPSPPQGNATNITVSGISEEDRLSFLQAVETSDMAPCVSIVDSSTRASCITQVALKVKNPQICLILIQKPDLDLCNLYAQGGA